MTTKRTTPAAPRKKKKNLKIELKASGKGAKRLNKTLKRVNRAIKRMDVFGMVS